jgi:tetratricopeptide (TPR) repeat protein
MRARLTTHAILTALVAALVLAAMVPDTAVAQNSNEALQQYIERTGELLEQAADVVLASESDRARRILAEAQRLHLRSQDMAGGGMSGQAYTLSRRARTAAEQAVRFAREAGDLEERVRLRLERYRDIRDRVLERAREANDELALRFITESEEQARRAADHYRQGNFAMAMQLVEPAEAMLARAARLLFEGGGEARLEQELERARQFIDAAAERLAAAGGDDAEAADLLDSARQALTRAEDLASRGQSLRALQTLRLARRLAGQASDALEGGVTPDALDEQFERWDQRQEQVAARVAESDSRDAAAMLEQARHHRQRAGALRDAGDLEQALRQLKAAFDLLNEASDLTR